MPAVKAPPFVPVELVARLSAAATAAGFRREEFGRVDGCPLLGLSRRTPGPRPRIYLSAGIHGDEPAGPLALLELIEAGFFRAQATWFLCPLLNPAGLRVGLRENAAGLDLNRDYRGPQSSETQTHIAWLRRQPNFDLTLCLHEDWEATGFYLYEQNPDLRPSLAEPMIEAVGKTFPIDPSPLIDEREARGGIIRPAGDLEGREKWPEAIYLRVHHTRLAYTLETPSALPLPARIQALRVAVETAVAQLRP
jgi:predicted deacylase